MPNPKDTTSSTGPPDFDVPKLETSVVGSRLLICDQLESTNDYAIKIKGDGTVIVAHHQTKGRGTRGKEWHSAPGLGLWFSVAFEREIRGLNFAAPLAVCDAIAKYCSPRIKWPNDILVDDKKVCGILIEKRASVTALGVGVNVLHATSDFPPELRDSATSLALQATGRIERGKVLHDILTELDKRVMLLDTDGYEKVYNEWSEACRIVGRRILYEDEAVVVESVDETGALIVKTSTGQAKITSGPLDFV